ncbi:MAG: hypothetical protein KJO29_08015 [Bacteroidia bacterium]|nr:hypothetical protein [Bacteroidia bacterium]
MKGHKSWIMTFLQNFCGILFLFSGWVKAVDPLGTAYKMEQYFAEFHYTFEGTWFGFIAPIFPVFAKQAILFSLAMIIFEMVLGLMLLLGSKPKFTSWAFILLIVFFGFLTGFTYLTGYVPEGVNFFSFGKWGEYNSNNMKVTDCGCFGDFIKLEPKTSFFKDVFLMFPALYFIFRHKDMHQLFTKGTRSAILWVFTAVLVYYCLANYKWNIPHADFRPFKQGVDIRAQFQAENDAMAAVEITDWKLKHNETGEEIILPNDEYLGNYKKYKGVYSVIDQIKDEPTIPITKISDFELTDLDGNDITEEFLNNQDAHFLIVNHKLKASPVRKTKTLRDTIFSLDTVVVFSTETNVSDTAVVRNVKDIVEKEEKYLEQVWKQAYLKTHIEDLKPFTDAAKTNGNKVLMVVGGADKESILQLDKDAGLGIDYGMADDILLKTIVRSNPGVVLMKDGKILNKWHINKLPSFEKVKADYLK